MEGERQAANVNISAVGVGGKNTGHSPSLCLCQLKFIQLLCQTGNTCEYKDLLTTILKNKKQKKTNKQKTPPYLAKWRFPSLAL